jgi:hypothetical protein
MLDQTEIEIGKNSRRVLARDFKREFVLDVVYLVTSVVRSLRRFAEGHWHEA